MKLLYLSFILALLPFTVRAQTDTITAKKQPTPEEAPRFIDRVVFGGNLGLTFGTETYVELSPLIGYKLSEKFTAGVGGTYIYYRHNGFDYENSVYGGRVFGRYQVIENIFGHGEYEVLNFKSPYSPDPYLSESLFIGAGLRQPLAGRVYTSLLFLYNVLWEQNESPYPLPFVIRGGITVGF